MENKELPNREEPNTSQEDDGNTLESLLRRSCSYVDPQTALLSTATSRTPTDRVDYVSSTIFTRERLFKAASRGDSTQLTGLLDFLRANNKHLTSSEFIDESNGKTALLKALLNLKDHKNDTIEVFLDVSEKTGDLGRFINASYTDSYYKGQTALHIAIEKRSFEHVKLLVQKGADVQAKASGSFFQNNEHPGFYFGELPLSLAACTNQPEVVSFLMDNPYKRADVTEKDSQGNTVLHALVVLADNTDENTDMIATMYDDILIQHHKLEKEMEVHLEEIENNQGLTPLKLAAKLGKIGLFKHMLHREFMDKETKPLSRKFLEWVYGPVHSSLYDMSSIDTDEENSVLEIIVFGSEIPNRPEMLQIEPLRSILKDKWKRFAFTLFWVNFLFYLVYLIIFTAVATHRKEGKPPFPIEVPLDYLRCFGELICILGALWFLYKSVISFKRNPPFKFKMLYIDGFCEILFFFQAVLLLIAVIMYFCGRKEYVGPVVISLALAWVNILYYTRGTKQLGIYNVMVQRMILGDILHFLFVYGVFLCGFTAAVLALIETNPPDRGRTLDSEPFTCKKPTYDDVAFTTLEMFKFTIGMGDLEFTDHVQYKHVFYILLIAYIILTYILLLNMLIALMGNTVERISLQTENIWYLQRSLTILDLESTLPRWLMDKIFSAESTSGKIVSSKDKQDRTRRFLRVQEMKWTQWKSDLCEFQQEDPGDNRTKDQDQDQDRDQDRVQDKGRTTGKLWNINPLIAIIRAKRQQPQNSNVP